ncbi:MAG: site-specific DNA-methyltransferase [Armatimonadota bacterium]|nr:site-specific DNA-methyltransferase [Armatimonadota bacterium]
MAEVDIIHHASCEDLSALEDNSVTLTVTSPPYWNAIDYDIHERDPNRWYRTRKYAFGYKEYDEYLDWVERIFGGVLAKTRPGGYCAVVIGTVLLNGRHYPVPFDLAARLSRSGWEFHQDIVWHKVTGGVKRAGVTIQKPYPGYFYPNIMTEYILVFRRPGKAIYTGRSRSSLDRARIPINRVFTMDVANTVWHIAPVPPGHLHHPCPFPEEIPYRLIQLYSYPGDLVLDPFAGSGQTLKVAKHLGRHFVGYDTVKKYVYYAQRRLDEPLAVRQKQLIAVFDSVPIDSPLAGPGRHGKGHGPRRRPRARREEEMLLLFT